MNKDFWRSLADRRIEEAQARGDMDVPDEARQRIDLTENPYVPEDKRMAYKIMADNDTPPEWIDDGKTIRGLISKAMAGLEQSYKTYSYILRKLDGKRDADSIYARLDAHQRWDEARARFRRAAAEINEKINTYNLRVPISSLQRLYLDADREIERIQGTGVDKR